MDYVFHDMIKIGVTFPKSNVKLPKGWTNLKESIYSKESNFAVLTGKINDIVVIDLDKKTDDFIALKWIEENLGPLNNINTLVTKTINDGYHIFFKYTPKLKNSINCGNKNIDILTNKKCCYQGLGYSIVYKNDIRELSNKEINLFLQLIKTKNTNHTEKISNELIYNYDNIINPKSYQKANKILNLPINTNWTIVKNDNGHKAIPKCVECLLDPCKKHSQEQHSSLFINKDSSVIKNCFSCGSIVLDKHNSKKINNVFNIILNTQENTVYQELVNDFLLECKKNLYKREKHTGIVYKRVKPYAYVKYMEPMDFLNSIFSDDPAFHSNINNMDNLIKYMKQYDHVDCPFLQYDKYYLGFSNGVLNIVTCEFTEIPPNNLVVRKYFDKEFTYSTDTPLMDKILDYQFNSDVRDFIYACLGRMFEIRDNYGFMLYLLGEAGCGKSVIIDILSECFNNVSSINESYEVKYGLASLYDKDIIVCDDLPKNISNIFPQQTFQSCVTGGKVSTAVKNKDAITMDWKVPMLWAGNWLPDYLDKGQISRRLLTANFEKIVNKPDPSLKKRIIENELPAFIYKCLSFYKKMIEKNDLDIWSICPEYFLEQKEELRIERNPFYKFLLENSQFKQDNIVTMEEIRENFSNWLGKKIYKLDMGTIKQVNSDYDIIKINLCKHCNKQHLKGCCEKYNSKDRTKKNIIRNFELIIQA